MAFVMKDEVFADLITLCKAIYEKGEQKPVDKILTELMNVTGVVMHCPYHHFIMPAALLTASALELGKSGEELEHLLEQAKERARTVPGGFCGNCGACGAAVGAGIFVSVLTGASPVTRENWQWANEVTGKCLIAISQYPGPRCCKRTSFLAVREAVPYINEKCGLHLAVTEKICCEYYEKNAQCLEEECPFYHLEKERVL